MVERAYPNVYTVSEIVARICQVKKCGEREAQEEIRAALHDRDFGPLYWGEHAAPTEGWLGPLYRGETVVLDPVLRDEGLGPLYIFGAPSGLNADIINLSDTPTALRVRECPNFSFIVLP
jgi:hypothetical protein